MKKTNRIFLSASVLFSFGAFMLPSVIFAEENNVSETQAVSDNTQVVESKVTQVTIYSDRAMVTRSAKFTVKAGENKVIFSELPVGVVQNTVQVNGFGNITIFDVQQKKGYKMKPQGSAEELNESMQDMKDNEIRITDEMNALTKKESLLEKVMVSMLNQPSEKKATGEVKAAYSFDEWTAAMDGYQQELSKISQNRRAKEIELRELKAEMQQLRWQIDQTKGGVDKVYQEVAVLVQAAEAGDAELELKYNIGGASWYPVYDVRFKEADKKLEVTYCGMITQVTGEDWDDANLTLSTARPSLGAYLPELYPWKIDNKAPEVIVYDAVEETKALSQVSQMNYGFSRKSGELAADMGDVALGINAATPAAPKADFATATIESGLTSAVFSVPTKISMKSGQEKKKVMITNQALTAELQWKSVPKYNATAFVNVSMTNTTPFPFLPGSMNTFLNNDFIAVGNMNTVMPGEKFQLVLGADEGIKIERKETKNFEDTTGWTNKTTRRNFEYTTTVTFNKKEAGRVVIFDQAPIPANEKIKVNIDSPKVKDLGVEIDNMNKVTWRIDMKPGEKRELKLSFTVEYPKDEAIYGL